MQHPLRVRPHGPLRALFAAAAALALLIALGYPFVPSPLQNQAQSTPAAKPFDCPVPANEGETWIARRWIERGELQLECTHIAGFPVFDLPIARRVGLVP